MPLDPRVPDLLEEIRRRGGRQAVTPTVAQARAAIRAYESLQGERVAVGRVFEERIGGPGSTVRVRIHQPPDGETATGCLVHFHGGGWVAGDPDLYDRTLRRLVHASGCVIVSVDYRRAPEHRFPAALDDCVAAVRWVHGNAAELGVDADRIGVLGDSAGGNLAAAACLVLRDDIHLRFAGLVYPLLDAAAASPSFRRHACGFGLETAVVRWYWKQYLGSDGDGADPLASPLRATSFAGLPPTFVATAQYDPVRDDGERYAEALAAAGVRVSLRRYDGMIHAFLLMGGVLNRTQDLIDDIGRAAALALAVRPPRTPKSAGTPRARPATAHLEGK